MTFTPTKKAYLNATLDIASSGSATSPDSAALSGIGIITQAPPPGLAQLSGDEGCLTCDGREIADRRVDRRALQGGHRASGTLANGERSGPTTC